MKRILIAIVALTCVVSMLAFGAQKAQDVERQLKAAMNTELVDGNLKAAIEQYKKVAQSGIRPLAAQALIHMAECYQKLGGAESREIYERVLREYTDQKEAVATARARLGVTDSTTLAKGDRAVWTGPMVDPFGRVSSDGRFITFVDWNTFRLMIHDVRANEDQPLTTVGYAASSTFSRDGKQIAYAWTNEGTYKLRVMTLQANGSPELREPRQLYDGSEDIRFFDPKDWSPDGKWIAVSITRKDGTQQIGLVALSDGSLRVLKSTDWGEKPRDVFFSSDSRYIAYDRQAKGNNARDLFVISIDGSRDIPVVVDTATKFVMGWSLDGKQLLFSSDRTGSTGLWAVPFADGKPQGPPELLRADIGRSVSLGLAASGALHVFKSISSVDVTIAQIDLDRGKLVGAPVPFVQGFVSGPRVPDWSPDGKYLAYSACDGNCLAVRSVDTGQVRQVESLAYVASKPRWSPDARWFAAGGRDQKGRDGLFRINAQTGEVHSVVFTRRLVYAAEWSLDGTKIYYMERDPPSLVEVDLTSGAQRTIIQNPLLLTGQVGLSPDARFFAVKTRLDPSSTKTSNLLMVPVDGGQPQELLQLVQPETFEGGTAWTPDSRSVLVMKTSGQQTEVWLVPISGAAPRKLDIDAESWKAGFSLSADGRRVAFLTGKNAAEVWALENFLRGAKPSK